MRNTLYYGDNLQVLREHVPDESVDLVYLDPPFNSNASYNVLFKEKTGEESPAQIKAFTDTWEWTRETERTYEIDIIQNPKVPSAVKEMISAFRQVLGEKTDMMAYLVMMAPRLVELYRALKPTGSLYLHRDPTAGHYLKILLDTIFGARLFRGEVIWKRFSSHNDARRNFAALHDTLLHYGRSTEATFNRLYTEHDPKYLEKAYRHFDNDGRRYRIQNLASPNPRPNPTYPYTALDGVTYEPHPNGWKVTQGRMRQLDEQERLHYPSKPTG